MLFLEALDGALLSSSAVSLVSRRIERPEAGWREFTDEVDVPSIAAVREVSILGQPDTFLVSDRAFMAWRKAVETGESK